MVFFLPTGKWEFPGLTSLNPRDIQSQILEAAQILILTSLPVGFLPDAHKSCFQSQLFQPGKKNESLKEQHLFSHHLAATTVQRPGTQPGAGARLAARRGEAEHSRLNQKLDLLHSSAKKAVFILCSSRLRVHLRYICIT